MRLRLEIRDLLLASWETDRESVRRALPPELEPADVEGRFLVTAVCLRARGGRLGRLPVPPFSQLNVRTYCTWEGEPAVFFVRSHVTPLGMGGALLGAPYRPSLLRFRRASSALPDSASPCGTSSGRSRAGTPGTPRARHLRSGGSPGLPCPAGTGLVARGRAGRRSSFRRAAGARLRRPRACPSSSTRRRRPSKPTCLPAD